VNAVTGSAQNAFVCLLPSPKTTPSRLSRFPVISLSGFHGTVVARRFSLEIGTERRYHPGWTLTFGAATEEATMNRLATFVLVLLIPLLLPGADGQQKSNLPQCPGPPTSYWDNCTGTRTFPSGTVYVGEFHNNGFNGQGNLRYADGDTYIGGFRDGHYEGQGAATFSDGVRYVGEVHNGMANGQGTYTYANGDKYNGELRDSKLNGQGTYTFANGTKVVGEFKDDTYIGPSTSPIPPLRGSSSTFEVNLDKQGGVLLVPVLINDKIPLDFVIDSGASDVSVPADLVSTLIRTGTLVTADFTGTQLYVLADGSKVPSQTFRIRSLKVGDLVLNDVAASVASAKGSLLLGQSILGRFKSWSIDNVRQVLVLGPKTI